MPWIDGDWREPINEDRAGWAFDAVDKHTRLTNAGLKIVRPSESTSDADDHRDELQTHMYDLLTNMRHLARIEGIDWEQLDETASCHYDEEVAEEEADLGAAEVDRIREAEREPLPSPVPAARITPCYQEKWCAASDHHPDCPLAGLS